VQFFPGSFITLIIITATAFVADFEIKSFGEAMDTLGLSPAEPIQPTLCKEILQLTVKYIY
jgi:hypothetical protein